MQTTIGQVGLNDNQKKAQFEMKVQHTENFVTALIKTREEWQVNAYTKSNDQLYALLAECYGSYLTMCTDSDDAKVMKKQYAIYVEENKIVFKSSTHVLTRIIRCVFGDTDKRRISTYGIVLRTAYAQKLKADEVVSFIKQSGGVQEIKLARTNALPTSAKADIAKTTVSAQVMGEFSSEMASQSVCASGIGEFVVFLATQRANGKFEMNAVIKNDSVVKGALAAYYSSNKAKFEGQIVEKKLANNDRAIAESINSAAYSLAA